MIENVNEVEKVEGEVLKEVTVQEHATMEFRLINPTEDGFLRVIKWNKDELEAAVRQKIADYENVVYTEENMQQAKNDRAELNKLTKAIEDRRKEVKKRINEPYDKFEKELKEILALIQKPVDIIDMQVKAFEEQQKEDKKKQIIAVYDEVIGDLGDVIPFEKVFDTRYLNKTYKLSTAQQEVKDKVQKVRTDLETIDSLDSEYKLNAKDVYIKTLDLSKALAENKRLADLKEKLEAEKRRKAEEEAERKRQEEIRLQKEKEKREAEEAAHSEMKKKEFQEPVFEQTEPRSEIGKAIESIERDSFAHVVEKEAQSETTETVVEPLTPKEEPIKEKKYRVRFCADGTKEQLAQLIKFMTDNGIEYRRINNDN